MKVGSIGYNDRVLLSGREFEKLLLSNAGQALLAAILMLVVRAGLFDKFFK